MCVETKFLRFEYLSYMYCKHIIVFGTQLEDSGQISWLEEKVRIASLRSPLAPMRVLCVAYLASEPHVAWNPYRAGHWEVGLQRLMARGACCPLGCFCDCIHIC